MIDSDEDKTDRNGKLNTHNIIFFVVQMLIEHIDYNRNDFIL